MCNAAPMHGLCMDGARQEETAGALCVRDRQPVQCGLISGDCYNVEEARLASQQASSDHREVD